MNPICLSENANFGLKKKLKEDGFQLIEIQRTNAVYEAVCAHADIYLCSLKTADSSLLVVAPSQLPLIREALEENHICYFVGSSPLGQKYPGDIRYNAAQVGRYLIHNTGQTDPVILAKAEELGLSLIHVRQGYTKCSLVVVDDYSVITSDQGIQEALSAKSEIETLLISPGHVKLEGFPYGFLGGASGRIGHEIIFNGDLSAHPDFEKIIGFINKRGLRPVWLPQYPLRDIGSILQL